MHQERVDVEFFILRADLGVGSQRVLVADQAVLEPLEVKYGVGNLLDVVAKEERALPEDIVHDANRQCVEDLVVIDVLVDHPLVAVEPAADGVRDFSFRPALQWKAQVGGIF